MNNFLFADATLRINNTAKTLWDKSQKKGLNLIAFKDGDIKFCLVGGNVAKFLNLRNFEIIVNSNTILVKYDDDIFGEFPKGEKFQIIKSKFNIKNSLVLDRSTNEVLAVII